MRLCHTHLHYPDTLPLYELLFRFKALRNRWGWPLGQPHARCPLCHCGVARVLPAQSVCGLAECSALPRGSCHRAFAGTAQHLCYTTHPPTHPPSISGRLRIEGLSIERFRGTELCHKHLDQPLVHTMDACIASIR